MSRDHSTLSKKSHRDPENAHVFKNISNGLKYFAIGAKKLPSIERFSPVIKFLNSITQTFKNYYKGENPEVAIGMTMVNLGFSMISVPYRVVRLTTPILHLVGFEDSVKFIDDAIDQFNKVIATNLINGGNLLLRCFIDNELISFSQTCQNTHDISALYLHHIRNLSEKYHWPQSVEDRFNILFAHQVAQHLNYHDDHRVSVNPELTTLSQSYGAQKEFDQGALEHLITHVFDQIFDTFEKRVNENLQKYFQSTLTGSLSVNEMAEPETLLIKMTTAGTEKIKHALANHSGSMEAARFYSTTRKSYDMHALHDNLLEISSVMHDTALLAGFCNQPKFSRNLAAISNSVQHSAAAIMKINISKPATLARFSGGLSLVTGITGIISGIISLFRSDPDPLEIISKQLNHISRQIENLGEQIQRLGKQMECVLKNQIAMGEMLILNTQQLDEIQCKLKQFAQMTGQQLHFITIESLIQASHNINLYLSNTSAIFIENSQLTQWILILQTWLTSPQHLCSKQINGALLNWTMPCSSKEAVEIFSSLKDWQSSLNMIGFILRQLAHKGIQLPEKYHNLPPLIVFMTSVNTYYLGLTKLERINAEGCQAIGQQMHDVFSEYSELMQLIGKNNRFWIQLLSLYLDAFELVENLLFNYLNFSHTVFRKNINDRLHEISNTNLKKQKFLDALYQLEEIRLLIATLAEWTDYYKNPASKLASMKDILMLEINCLNDFHYPLWHSFYDENLHKQIKGSAFDLRDKINIRLNDCFKNPSFESIKYWQYLNLTELFILHMATNTHGAIKHDFFSNVISYFTGVKLTELRATFRYYFSYVNHDDETCARVKSTVNPKMLLFIVSILGRYSVFETMKFSRSSEFAECLLEKSFSNLQCMQNMNPLMMAAKWNRIDVVQSLLQLHQTGKDIGLSHRNCAGKSAAEIAFENRHYHIAGLLDEITMTLSVEQHAQIQQKMSVENVFQSENMHLELIELFNAGKAIATKIQNLPTDLMGDHHSSIDREAANAFAQESNLTVSAHRHGFWQTSSLSHRDDALRDEQAKTILH